MPPREPVESDDEEILELTPDMEAEPPEDEPEEDAEEDAEAEAEAEAEGEEETTPRRAVPTTPRLSAGCASG